MTRQQKINRLNATGRKVKFDLSGKIVVGIKSFDSVNAAYKFYFN